MNGYLDHFHELLKLPPPEPGRPAQVLLHSDPLGLQELLLSKNVLFV